MGNIFSCCTKKTHLIFSLGTNDAFLNALQGIEEKCNKRDEIIIMWTGSPSLDEKESVGWSSTAHNTRASSNSATIDVHYLIQYYQSNGWDMKVIVCNKEITRGFSVAPENETFFCKNSDGTYDEDNSKIFTNLCEVLGIKDITMDYLSRTPVSSRTGKPRGSFCSDIKTVAMLFMYLEDMTIFETEHRYLKTISFEEKGELPLYYKGDNENSIEILKFDTSRYTTKSEAIKGFDLAFTNVLMQHPEFYRNFMPSDTTVMAICTDFGDPYNESGDTGSKNMVNDFDDLVAIAMICCLEGNCDIFITMKEKNIQDKVYQNVTYLMKSLNNEFIHLTPKLY
ncbi:MAG: hypothetical protein ACI9YE_000398 [Psychroserpens sp.]|jgi:hypothetical protein